MPDSPQTYLLVALQTLAIYLFLVVGLRLMGRHTMGQLTAVEYLVVALLGSSVETGLYMGSGSLGPGLVSAATLCLANRALSLAAARLPRVRRLLISEPLLLVHDGQMIDANMRKEEVTEADLQAAIRQHGYSGVDKVRYAVLEADGSIGVVPRPQEAD